MQNEMNPSTDQGTFAKRKALREIVPNLIFFGIGVVVFLFLAERWMWIGKLACLGYGLILVFDLLRLFAALFAGVRLRLKETGYIAAFFVQVFEVAVFSIYFYLLLSRTFLSSGL